MAGAEHVTGVDASELGVAQARENAALNGLEDRVEFICEDVFDLLPRLEKQGEKFRRGDPGSACVYKVQKFDQKSSDGIQGD